MKTLKTRTAMLRTETPPSMVAPTGKKILRNPRLMVGSTKVPPQKPTCPQTRKGRIPFFGSNSSSNYNSSNYNSSNYSCSSSGNSNCSNSCSNSGNSNCTNLKLCRLL